MAKLPKIDLTEFIQLLKFEGGQELRMACAKALGASGRKVVTEWDAIIRELDIIAPKLAKGTEVAQLAPHAKTIAKSAANLSLMASQVLSFVPGPVGMVCSAANAIVCFVTLPFPANIGNGFLELLGCIPGGKVAGKLAPKVEKILIKAIEKTPGLRELIIKQQQIAAAVQRFARKAKPTVEAVPTAKVSVTASTTPRLNTTLTNKKIEKPGSIFSPETIEKGRQIPKRQYTVPGSGTTLPKKGGMKI